MEITSSEVTRVLICFLIGIFVAFFAQFVLQKMYGKFLKSLQDAGATDDTSAKAPDELGCNKNFLIKIALKRRNTLTFIIKSTKDENGKLRYYIPKEKSEKAASVYRSNEITPVSAIILVVGIVAIFLLCKYALPLIFK